MGSIDFDFQIKLIYILFYILIIILTRKINFAQNGLNDSFKQMDRLNIPTILSFLQIFTILIYKKKKKKISSIQLSAIINNTSDFQNESNENSFDYLNNLKTKKNFKLKSYIFLFLCGLFEGIRYYLSITLLIGKKDISFIYQDFFILNY